MEDGELLVRVRVAVLAGERVAPMARPRARLAPVRSLNSTAARSVRGDASLCLQFYMALLRT